MGTKPSDKNEEDMTGASVVENLRESYRKIGPLRPALVTQYGIAGGETRKQANPNWPEQNVKVASYYDHLRLRAADNVHARKPVAWWTALLGEAAEELIKQGVRPGYITARLVNDFPLAERTIMAYLPKRYKSPVKARAGSLGGSAAAVAATAPGASNKALTIARMQSPDSPEPTAGASPSLVAMEDERLADSEGTKNAARGRGNRAVQFVQDGEIALDLPGNKMQVTVSPLTQMYYAYAMRAAEEKGLPVITVSEFIDRTVREFFEEKGYVFSMLKRESISIQGSGV